MTVDATARIPTGIGLVRDVNTYSHHVPTLMDIRGNIVLKTGITIRARTYLHTVYINGRIHIDSVELQEGFLAACWQ
jgi:hypothetical protein